LGCHHSNITQTGDVLVLRKVHRVILGLLARIMTALTNLAERSADMVMAGRTHGQHAVPITFGLKVASWIDEIGRHISRMRELEPRLFVAIVGGAAGNFASLGDRAPEVQDGVAKRLGLAPIMLELGKTIGRQYAHDVVYQAAQAAASQNLSSPDRLAADDRVTAHLSQSAIDALLDPASHTGLSASIAHQQVEVARRFVSELHAHLQS
jgi:adenylosuccinate lyase